MRRMFPLAMLALVGGIAAAAVSSPSIARAAPAVAAAPHVEPMRSNASAAYAVSLVERDVRSMRQMSIEAAPTPALFSDRNRIVMLATLGAGCITVAASTVISLRQRPPTEPVPEAPGFADRHRSPLTV